MELSLSKSYNAINGMPIISYIDDDIFKFKYFSECLSLQSCKNHCCQYGVDVDFVAYDNILKHKDDLEKYTGINPDKWFYKTKNKDKEYPGGGCVRTRVLKGGCIFLKEDSRGCMIHSFCLKNNMDYHLLKPMISCLFPLTFGYGILSPADEVYEDDYPCFEQGKSLYQGIRPELKYYFGLNFVKELDELERKYK